MASIKQQNPDWQSRLLLGDIDFVRQWLAENIRSQGRFMESQELTAGATGANTDAQWLLQHLEDRYIKNAYYARSEECSVASSPPPMIIAAPANTSILGTLLNTR